MRAKGTNLMTQWHVRRCADHGLPTAHHGGADCPPRCSGCDDVAPYWHELDAIRPHAGWSADLRVEIDGRVRVWTERTSVDDGSPYARTVTVETYDGETWSTVAQYDGDDPPARVDGVNLRELREAVRDA